jgi:hypothetical protein
MNPKIKTCKFAENKKEKPPEIPVILGFQAVFMFAT